MRVEVLGCQGGVSQGYNATSYLIDDVLLLDAGTAASALPVERQASIDHIMISHAHLDHVKDLGFLCDNCLGKKTNGPFLAYSHLSTITALKNHIFNNAIWPDFASIPSPENPMLKYREIIPEVPLEVGGFTITPVQVNHPGDTCGFIVEKGESCVVFTFDTAATSRIWEIAKEKKNVKAIFTEVSFPDSLLEIARLSYHFCPQTFAEEYKKMPQGVPIYITHLKPAHQEKIIMEVQKLDIPDIHILHHDGQIYKFD
jgi:cAMP phosphodiesterase